MAKIARSAGNANRPTIGIGDRLRFSRFPSELAREAGKYSPSPTYRHESRFEQSTSLTNAVHLMLVVYRLESSADVEFGQSLHTSRGLVKTDLSVLEFADALFPIGAVVLVADRVSEKAGSSPSRTRFISVGNARTVDEILGEAPGEAVRLAVLMSHYRQPFDWTPSRLRAARSRLDRWYWATDGADADPELPASFVGALQDDLNTPGAIGALDKMRPSAVRAGAEFLGLLSQPADEWFRWQPKAQVVDEVEITALIEQRSQARQAGDFEEADRIRAVLGRNGIALEDVSSGTRWRRKM